MLNIITAFAIILLVIAIGYALNRGGVLRTDADRGVINRVVFYAALPALMFSEVSQTDASDLLSPVILVTLVATVLTGVAYCVLSVIFLRRDLPTTAAGAGASLYVNAVNIGLPVMSYVLGDAAYMAPIIIIQAVLINPLLLAGLASGGVKVTQLLQRSLFTPVMVATLAGLVFTLSPWSVPEPILAPASILGAAAVPLVLVSFGASLGATRVLQVREDRPSVLTASAMKLVGMPAIAWGVGLLWGLETEQLYAVLILAALPSAQNVYNFAATYGKGTIVARDTVFITTFAALPVMLAIAALFGQ
jgi:malonate transporter and related proteins